MLDLSRARDPRVMPCSSYFSRQSSSLLCDHNKEVKELSEKITLKQSSLPKFSIEFMHKMLPNPNICGMADVQKPNTYRLYNVLCPKRYFRIFGGT